MAWVAIPNLTDWQYDNDPPDPGGAESALWALQTAGVRTVGPGGHQVYTRVRKVGDGNISRGEISKTYWDAH